ncbi:uncharacterized protein LOC6579718 [Drosophila mojavensis]|uniref:Uncharacterized protein n=1 Tax=Drosophila mojavensis TaxID=7230 RepID=B4KT15_DROMO|nr:uncharacterized protein LOC6579718 [Drosophila mojavensis]EDW09535.1 uncharacterized protein Dmoj_GI18983 [Drosophila mojavensis]
MEVPLSEFSSLDLERELYARAKNTDGLKQERFGRLLAARQQDSQSSIRQRRSSIAKFGARLQMDDFAEIKMFDPTEFEFLSNKVRWRLDRVRRTEDGEGLEYFHPDVLSRIDRSKTYMLNMDEFLVRQEPYIHKIFVIFISRTCGQEHKLCYARSLAKLRSWDEQAEEFEWPLITTENITSLSADNAELQTTLITTENIAKALSYVLGTVKDNNLENIVAIACDTNRLGVPAITMLLEASGHVMPPTLYDIYDLQITLQNMFCSACVRILMRVEHEIYTKTTYGDQLCRLCSGNRTKNMNAVLLLMEYVNKLPQILNTMWSFEEHLDKPISLIGLNNRLLKIYGSHIKRELPPITFEDCAAGSGLLQLIVFDALWCISTEAEPEEINLEVIVYPPHNQE